MSRIFPARCLSCRQPGSRFCARCLQALEARWETRAALEVGTLGVYNGALRRAVLRLKESNDRLLTGVLARRLAQLSSSRLGVGPVQVVGVPTSLRRQRWRGYCAPQRLAEVVAAQLGWTLLTDLRCLGDPAPRKALNSFQLRRSQSVHFHYQGRLSGTVVLIDDVVTSGQTLAQARLALLRAGAERVEVVCLARSR